MFLKIAPYIGYIVFIVVLSELLFAAYRDLVEAKFSNKFALVFLALNVFLVFLLRGLPGLSAGALTFGVAVLLLAPIYLTRILGGGDIKLLLALSPLLFLDEYITFLLLSVLWAGLFGFLRSLVGGSLKALIMNTLLVSRKVTLSEDRIPFTVGILLAWCSYKTFMSLGVL